MGSGETPAKRPRVESGSLTCVICSANAPRAELVNPRDRSSWATLLRNVEIHDFQPNLQLSAAEENIPGIFYRECRSVFTHKKTLICFQGKTVNTEQDSRHEKQWVSQGQPTSSSSGVYEKICIFCEKSNKNIKRSHSREPLIQASELRVDGKVRVVATIKMDKNFKSQEFSATEAHYHKTSYRDYTREY